MALAAKPDDFLGFHMGHVEEVAEHVVAMASRHSRQV
jgi:hypothetical protein